MNYKDIKNIYINILKYNCKIKCFGDGKYKLTGYYKNGNKWWEAEYQNNNRHCKYITWYDNGNKCWERDYENNTLNWYKKLK